MMISTVETLSSSISCDLGTVLWQWRVRRRLLVERERCGSCCGCNHTYITTTTTPALHRKSSWTPIEISTLKTTSLFSVFISEIRNCSHSDCTYFTHSWIIEYLCIYAFYQTQCVFIRNILMISSHVSWHWHHTYSDLCPLISVTGVSAGLRSADGNISYQQLLSTLSLLFITQTTVC